MCTMFEEVINNKKIQPNLIDVLSLAFVGDAVHSLYVRTKFVLVADFKQKDLQAKTSAIVCAKNQCGTLELIQDELTEDEKQIMLRARNAHTNNKAKNSTLMEYKLSTAFEAVIGYLFIQNKIDRLNHFLDLSIQNVNKSTK